VIPSAAAAPISGASRAQPLRAEERAECAARRAMGERLRVGVGDDEFNASSSERIMFATALPPAPPTRKR